MLVEDALCSCAQHLTVVCRDESAERPAKTYHSLVLCGKLRTAVRWITEWEKGGVLLPEETCTKTGERVMEVMRTKMSRRTPPRLRKAWTHILKIRRRCSLSTSQTMW